MRQTDFSTFYTPFAQNYKYNTHVGKTKTQSKTAYSNNLFWEGTPLYELYKFYLGEKGDNATAQTEAAKAVGILLKKVLYDDQKREYSTKKVQETRNGKLMDIRKYCWTGVEYRN